MRRTVSVVLLALALALSSWTVALTAADEHHHPGAEEPGFVMLQVDGLSEPVLRAAVEDEAMPFVRRLLEEGSHVLGRWRTTTASATPVTQAGLLHGTWRDIPGFRWWDREAGRMHDFLDRAQARDFADSLSGPRDLLAAGGASITNLFDGGAPRVALTASDLAGVALAWEVVRFVADVPKDVHVADGLVDGVTAGLLRLARGQAAPFAASEIKRKAPVPVVGPALEWAFVDVTAAAVLREIQRGTPLVYATFATYDEVGHYAGSRHPAAFEALRHIDRALEHIDRATSASSRPYHLIILSDHGQTEGQPFAVRWGETLTEVIRELMTADDGKAAASPVPDLVVAASGNLAHVYFPRAGQRLDAAEIEALHPGLVSGLAAQPGIGLVAIRADGDGDIVIGHAGSHDLASGRVEGRDPLEAYGPLAATSMANIAAAAHAGDLVLVATYDPRSRETFSFEPQLGSHGGIGGPQTEPFLLYPRTLEGGEEPLSLVGVDELRATFDRWLAPHSLSAPVSPPDASPSDTSPPDAAPSDASPPDRSPPNTSTSDTSPDPPAGRSRSGDEVCVSAGVDGATGEVCARRDGFGVAWTTEIVDESDDGRSVRATIGLEMAEAPDESTAVSGGEDVSTVRASGRFDPRYGERLGEISIETCVVVRFAPDPCRTASAPLPRLPQLATPAQRERLETLVFEMPLDRFMEEWTRDDHGGLDAGFDWSSDGCSAGPLRELFDERLQAACIRHDFAYRNLGQLGLDATDEVRRRVDARLAADVAELGSGRLGAGLEETLRLFAAPVFYGDDLASRWGVPDFIARRLGSADLRSAG